MADVSEVFLIGDDGSITADDQEITSAQEVSFGHNRAEIESRARSSDNVNHRAGKMKKDITLTIRKEPDDAGLAVLETAHDDNEPVEIALLAEAGDEIDSANFIITDLGGSQPLEDNQTYEITMLYHSDVSAS